MKGKKTSSSVSNVGSFKLSRQKILPMTMTETRFYEPARLSIPPKPLFSLKLLDATV